MAKTRNTFYAPGGLDVSVQANQIPPNKSPDISNFVIEDGRLRTAPGLAKSTTNAVVGFEPATEVGMWRELNGTVHRLVSTLTHIYEINDDGTATKRSGNGIWARQGWYPGIDDPVWFHAATNASEYLCIATKAQAPMYYWKGYNNFTQLRTTYNSNPCAELRPLQSTMFYNRLFLLAPDIVQGGGDAGTWVQNSQMLMWSNINAITDYDNGNAGYVLLLDTGGQNVGMRQMACSMVVYQDNSIWNVHHVGGTTVFNPTCALTDYGLWGARLLQSVGLVHYFVNSYDANIYRYQGGSTRPVPVGNDIWPDLRADLETSRAYPNRSYMTYDPSKNRLWIFTLDAASGYARKAYFLDINSGQWSTRDYTAYLTTGATGLTGGCFDKYTDRALLLCSGAALVFDQQDANTDDAGTAITAYRNSSEQDGNSPDTFKKYDTLAFEAKAANDGDTLVASVKVDGGSGLASSWDPLGTTISLSTAWKSYRVPLQTMGGRKIQTRIANNSGSIVEIRSIREPGFEIVRDF